MFRTVCCTQSAPGAWRSRGCPPSSWPCPWSSWAALSLTSCTRLSRPTPLSWASCRPSPPCRVTWDCRPVPTPSGGLGQVSTSRTRGLVLHPSLGQITSSSYLRNMGKEIKSGFLSSTIIACIICTIGTVWAYAHPENSDINITWENNILRTSLIFYLQRPRASIRVRQHLVHGHLDLDDDRLCQWFRNSHSG